MRIEIINPQLLARLLMVFGLLVFTNALAGTKDFALHQAVLDDDKQLVTRLLNKGAAINVIGSRKYGYGSALHLAVREGHLEIANLLLKRGAEVDVLDPDDFTPLHNAAWNGNLEMTELLLDAGADIEASTYDGDTPLSLAQNNNQPKVAEFIQAKLLASPVVDTKVASTPVSDSGVIDISGTYIAETTASGSGMNHHTMRGIKKLNGKLIVLKQTGNTITGSVSTQSDWIISTQSDEIKGTLEGNVVNFFIIRADEIIGSWEINADATKLEGKWFTTGAGGASGKWNLTKIETDVTQIIDVSGTYISEITYPTHGEFYGDAQSVRFVKKKNRKEITLEQTGNAISGFDGTKDPKIIGTRDGNTINFYVLLPDQINGTWEINADGTEMVGKWDVGGRGLYGTWKLTKVVATKVKSTTGSEAGVIDISGTYINTELTYPSLVPRHYYPHFFGDGSNLKVTIKQSGNAITGVISGNSTGEFKGVIKGREITFESSMSSSLGPVFSSGKGTWLVSNDGDALTGSYRLYSTSFGSTIGNWGYGDVIGNWNFRKIESTADSHSEVRDVSGTYVMTNITGNWVLGTFVTKPRSKDVHEITIAQNGDQLTGTYDEGRGKLWGEIKGDTIRFDWVRGTKAGKGKWTFKPGSNESSVSLNAHSGSGVGLITEAKFNLTKTE